MPPRFRHAMLPFSRSFLLLGAIFLGVLGCDSPVIHTAKRPACPSGDAPNIAEEQTEFSDKDLRCAVYTDYKFPDGFYQEDLSLPDREGKASIYYENTVSIDSSNKWTEFCTNELSRAWTLSERSADSNSYYRRVVDTTITEKFFQFRRVSEQNPRDVLLSRVHKCSYFTPSDSFHHASPVGPRDEGSATLGT